MPRGEGTKKEKRKRSTKTLKERRQAKRDKVNK